MPDDEIDWTCLVLHPDGDVLLRQMDPAGREWCGGRGERLVLGGIEAVLTACVGTDDAEWIDAVAAAVASEIEIGRRRTALVVFRGAGEMFHVSRRANRESILEHGLHSRYMTGVGGIAGSSAAEWPGTFLCDEESVEFFATMALPDQVDVWAVDVSGRWLQGAPDAGGGGDGGWVVAEQLLEPTRLRRLGA